VSYEKLGSVFAQQDQALALSEKSREIGARLTKLDPSNAQWKADLDRVSPRIAELKKLSRRG
jgi:hypothetical protein